MTGQKAYMDQWFHLHVECRLQTSSNGSYKLKGRRNERMYCFFFFFFFTLMMTLTRLWNLFCPDDDLPKTIIGRKEGRKRQTHVSSHAPCVWPDPSIHHTPSGWYSYFLLGCSLATKTHLQNCTSLHCICLYGANHKQSPRQLNNICWQGKQMGPSPPKYIFDSSSVCHTCDHVWMSVPAGKAPHVGTHESRPHTPKRHMLLGSLLIMHPSPIYLSNIIYSLQFYNPMSHM